MKHAVALLGLTHQALSAGTPLSAHTDGAWHGATALLEHGFEKSRVNPDTAAYKLPEVKHEKEAGKGYLRGSRLYEEQQEWKKRPQRHQSYHAQVLALWKTAFLHNPMTAVALCSLQAILVIAIAYMYKRHKPAMSVFDLAEKRLHQQGNWAYHPFDASDMRTDWPICCMACWCPAIRWADTIGSDSMRRGSFWPAFFVFFILMLLAPMTFGFSILVALCFGIYCRQEIRRKFQKERSWKSYLSDCFLWCCCPCCAIIQEAREVEKVLAPPNADMDRIHTDAHMNSAN
jgi:Cys-rich protein (TIGR01571 family)